jgi:hypothetical protein
LSSADIVLGSWEPVNRRRIRALWKALQLAIALCTAAAWASTRPAQGRRPQNHVLALWIDGVTRGSLEPIVNDLSGETAPLIGGAPFGVLPGSSTSSRSAEMAEQDIYEHLRGHGLIGVDYHSYARQGVTHRNVVSDIAGTAHPYEIVIVGARHNSPTKPVRSLGLDAGTGRRRSAIAARRPAEIPERRTSPQAPG